MDKHIYTCDNTDCIMSDGFIYLHVQKEDRMRIAEASFSDLYCPVCNQSIRLIESIFESSHSVME